MDLNGLFDGRIDIIFDARLTEERFDWKCSSRDNEDRHVAEEITEFLRVHRRRCDNQLQILTACDDFTQQTRPRK